ncbi:hypothetical protein ACFOZY_08605 [Chungangia koreensis]|uniref:Uncharacterized protein n=1 Tax=Chungangia koreensis TaxID=752657 RepID=A0ABV8X3H4_9LACT
MMHIICRKLIATYFTAALIGIFFGFLIAIDSDSERAVSFYGMSLVVLYYGGIIILLYGNATSFLSEYINKRWLRDQTHTFLLFHLLFGIGFGVFFNLKDVVLLGMLGALIYALTDRLLYKRREESKIAFVFLLSPPAVFLLGIVFFWVT